VGAGALASLPADWRRSLADALDRPPQRPRQPLHWKGHAIGSVEPELLAQPALRAWLASAAPLQPQAQGWAVRGDDLSASLARIAAALRDAGLAHTWRNELLAVRDAHGQALGAVERAVARVLGVATEAVHLAAWAPDGGFWLQQRAFDKPTDPGLWDTLVGGMVPAGETHEGALPRETAEEAGLQLAQLRDLAYGGCLQVRRPAAEVRHGYVVERLHWWRAVLPEGVSPANQDGEVAGFACMPAAAVARRLAQGEFTLDAAAILLRADAA
jgi:8-oxo-dGTP pyrophosphatase MutT (NUDIX family)